jgi:hypothetical protein
MVMHPESADTLIRRNHRLLAHAEQARAQSLQAKTESFDARIQRCFGITGRVVMTAQARRVRSTMPRPARPITSSRAMQRAEPPPDGASLATASPAC